MAETPPYRWRPSNEYQQWHVCDTCLIPLADVLQDRVEKWVRPPHVEEDDQRPDYEEIYQRRYHEVFLQPLDLDLQHYDFERCKIWLSIHAPNLATLAAEKIDQLRAALTPPEYGFLDTDAAIVCLADTSFFLHQAAEEVRPLAGGTEISTNGKRDRPTSRIDRREANQIAMDLAKKNPNFVLGGVRDWAAAIQKATGKTCSVSTVENTPLWKETMKTTGRGRNKGGRPKAVSLTEGIEATVGKGSQNEVLQRLIEDQATDFEPSPLDDKASRRVRYKKRL